MTTFFNAVLAFIAFAIAYIVGAGGVGALFCGFLVMQLAQIVTIRGDSSLFRTLSYSLVGLTLWMLAAHFIFLRSLAVDESDAAVGRTIDFAFWVLFGCVNASLAAFIFSRRKRTDKRG